MSNSDPATVDDGDFVHGPLAARLLAPDTFERFAVDCKKLIEAEVKKKGMALRTAVNVVQKVKPDIIDRGVRELLPEFVHQLESGYADYSAGGHAGGTGDFRAYLITHDAWVADAALSVADRRAERIQSRTIDSAYRRVRGRAHREILAAVPEIATVLARHAEPAK